MGILNYLPSFKIVEVNRSTALINGHVLSQFKLDPASALIKTVGAPAIEVVENGFIVGLGADLQIAEFDATTHAQPFFIFTEEINTFMDGLKYFATEEDADGDIYPRALALYVGDAFTTNNYAGTLAGAKFAKVVAGVLTLQTVADANTLFAVEETTIPTGEDAVRAIYINAPAV